jgi:hypothetical protein
MGRTSVNVTVYAQHNNKNKIEKIISNTLNTRKIVYHHLKNKPRKSNRTLSNATEQKPQ